MSPGRSLVTALAMLWVLCVALDAQASTHQWKTAISSTDEAMFLKVHCTLNSRIFCVQVHASKASCETTMESCIYSACIRHRAWVTLANRPSSACWIFDLKRCTRQNFMPKGMKMTIERDRRWRWKGFKFQIKQKWTFDHMTKVWVEPLIGFWPRSTVQFASKTRPPL